jgi:hypothetical protein
VRLGLERGIARSALGVRRRLSLAPLRRRAWDDGLLGGDRRWLAVGAVVWTITLLGRAWRREPEVVYRTVLKPGETLSVSTQLAVAKAERPPAGRKRRKKA